MSVPDHINKHSSLPDDEGEITILCYVKNGHVVLDFGKDLSWLGMHADHARTIAHTLLKRADELEKLKETK
jgi:hypothetical protein